MGNTPVPERYRSTLEGLKKKADTGSLLNSDNDYKRAQDWRNIPSVADYLDRNVEPGVVNAN